MESNEYSMNAPGTDPDWTHHRSIISKVVIAVKPYVPINAKSEYGTVCVPMGSKLAEGSFTGFDKLHPVAQDNSTIGVGAYRAYLELPGYDTDGGYAKTYQMVFEDNELSSVKGIYDNAGSMAPVVYYDLIGRRINSPAKGQVYIVNGKKVRL